MKVLILSLLFTVAAAGQTPIDAKVVTFDRADKEHCRVIAVGGKPLLESTFGGISVAVGLPENRGNGEFSVYVSIYQLEAGTAKVNPKDFSALYSDTAHTRFGFYDKSAEFLAPAEAPAGGMSAQNSQIDTSLMRGAPMGGGPPGGGAGGPGGLRDDSTQGPPPGAGTQPPATPAPALMHRATIKQGSRVAGLVFFRKPKGSKLLIGPTDMLGEIEIPVNGIVFRF